MNKTYRKSILFQPVVLGRLSLKNRIVMAPMTRGFSPEGVPGDDVAAYYARRAAHGVGLIITEGTLVRHPAAACSPSWPLFYGEKSLQGWKKQWKRFIRRAVKLCPSSGMWACPARKETLPIRILKRILSGRQELMKNTGNSDPAHDS